MLDPWVDTTAIVTGASGAIGSAIAETLLSRGMHVVLAARDPRRLRAARDRMSSGLQGQRIEACATDVTSVDSIKALAAAVALSHPVCTVLVNAAATAGRLAPLLDTSPEDWWSTMGPNLDGAFLMCRQFVPGMVDHGWGRVVNVTSIASVHEPAPLMAAYRISKVALNALTASLASELQGSGVTVNALHPGNVASQMARDIEEQAHDHGDLGAHLQVWANGLPQRGDDPHAAGRLVDQLLQDQRTGWFVGVGEDEISRPIHAL